MHRLKDNNKLADEFSLLAKGGNSGKEIISKDWTKNQIGPISGWPSELLIALGIILYSEMPMIILWGPELVCFYNDAFCDRADYKEKKTGDIGIPVKDALPQIWKQLKTGVENVYAAIESNSVEISTAVSCNKKREDTSNDFFSYSPLINRTGSIAGVLAIAREGFTEPTEKKSNESTLSEERLRLALDASEMAIWEVDLRNDTIEYSNKLLEILGYDLSKKLTLHDIREQIYLPDRQRVKDAFNDSLQNGKYKFEVRAVKPGGAIIYVRTAGKVFFDDAGNPSNIIGTLRDITKEEENREALEKSERRLRRLILNAPVAIGILDGPEYRVEIMNELALTLMGKTGKQMLNKPVLDSITELDPASTKALLDSVYYTGKSFSASEFPVKLNRFGKFEKVYINFVYQPLVDSQEKVYGIMVVGIDVTEQVTARHKIEENEARFRLLADSMPQFVWSADEAGNINYFNKAVFDYSGLTNEEVQNGGWLKVVHPDEKKESVKQWRRAVSSGKDFTFEHRFRNFEGQYSWQLSRAVPLRNEGGKIQQWIGTSTNIDDMKVQEQHKDFFISMASHELKTPITSMKGYVQILQSMYENGEDEFLKKSLERVHVQIEKLTTIIGDLLDLSKIRKGSLTFDKQNFEINLLIQEVIEEMEVIYSSHKIIFQNNGDLHVHADRERVSQVLINLITNAIKYSPKKGNIIITSQINQKMVMISVKDEGIGIEKNFQRKIFERFYRVEGKNEKTFPGFGIGLFIASEIIRRHKGSIGVESEPGEGSMFYFSLPLAKKTRS
ncbi:MAG: PAS domain-containing sensor histidine kinase [Ginsengibacter sp.]